MRPKQRIFSMMMLLTMLMAICTSCLSRALRPEAVLWGVWTFIGGERGSQDYAYDLYFQKNGELTLLGRAYDSITYMVSGPGQLRMTSRNAIEELIYSLEANNLTLHFTSGSNTYTRAPDARQTEQAAHSPSDAQSLPEVNFTQNTDDPKVIRAENAQQVIALNIFDPYQEILSVALSPDGTIIAFGTSIGIYIYDFIRSVETAFIDTPSYVRSVAFSPDGRILAWGGEDGAVRLYDIKNNTLLQTLSGNTGWVDSLAFSPDGRTLASGGLLSLCLWDVANGALLHTLGGHFLSVNTVAFAPDGLTLVSGSMDENIRVWDINSGTLLTMLAGHTDSVRSLAFSPDGRLLVSGSDDGNIIIWDPGSWTLVRTLEGHRDWIWSVAFSPDGQTLASGSWDGTVRLWDAVSGAHLHTLKVQYYKAFIFSLAFAPNGRTLVSGSGPGAYVWGIPDATYNPAPPPTASAPTAQPTLGITRMPTAAPTPTLRALTEPRSVDKTDPQSVFEWAKYAITVGDASLLGSFVSDQGVWYKDLEIDSSGFVLKSKQDFLRDLQNHLTHQPACEGAHLDEGQLVIWFRKWQPGWQLSLIDPTNAALVFSYQSNGYQLTEILLYPPFHFFNPSPTATPNAYTLIACDSKDMNNPSYVDSCPGSIPQRMEVGQRGRTCTLSDSVRLRVEPGLDGSIRRMLPPDTEFEVIGGPECAGNNWSWWQIRLDSGTIGWIAEGGDDVDLYFICPID